MSRHASRVAGEISKQSKIFAPANMRAAQELPQYAKLIDHWMTNRYTLRYSGGLVPDICQQFTKKQGVFANPTSVRSTADGDPWLIAIHGVCERHARYALPSNPQ